MSMQRHILLALREQFAQWEALISRIPEAQIVAPRSPSALSPKDELAHLHAWQLRSIARLEAAVGGGEPVFAGWEGVADPQNHDDTDRVNDWIFATYRDLPWQEIYRRWRDGYMRMVELGGAVDEPALLDSERFGWLDGYPLACVLIASYDHHQEHLDGALAWLGRADAA